MKLSELKANPNNPRLIKDDNFQKLVKSLQEFPEMMVKRPMVCVTDADGKLYPLGGNMRLRALQELKYKDIPDNWVQMADEWTEEQRKEFTIKDNSGFGEWDWDELSLNWNADQLKNWGLEVPDWENKFDIKEVNIYPYKKTHVLLSFNPDLLEEIQEYLQKIKNIAGVEYEQSSN